MIKTFAFALGALLTIASANATTSIFGGYIVLDINGTGDTFYKLENPADNTNPSFNGTDLGTFDPAVNSLFFSGGEALTNKSEDGDVLSAEILYRIFLTGNPSGSFVSTNLPFAEDLGSGNQKWNSLAPNDNLLAGLAPGTYAIQTYLSANTNEGIRYLNNGGADYVATFTVIPEPSSLSLLGGPVILGAWLFARRRRS